MMKMELQFLAWSALSLCDLPINSARILWRLQHPSAGLCLTCTRTRSVQPILGRRSETKQWTLCSGVSKHISTHTDTCIAHIHVRTSISLHISITLHNASDMLMTIQAHVTMVRRKPLVVHSLSLLPVASKWKPRRHENRHKVKKGRAL